jgi:hypothetical protein
MNYLMLLGTVIGAGNSRAVRSPNAQPEAGGQPDKAFLQTQIVLATFYAALMPRAGRTAPRPAPAAQR